MIEGLTNIDFYKDRYDKELQIKLHISTQVRLPITILSLLFAGAFYLIKEYSSILLNSNKLALRVFILFQSLILVGFFLMAIINLIKMYDNGFKKYKYLPLSNVFYEREKIIFDEYSSKFKNIDALNDDEYKNAVLEYSKKYFQTELVEYYVECSSHNQKLNEKRFKYYYASRRLIFVSFGILIILWTTLINI